MKLTTNHPASSYGMPIFIHAGNPIDYAEGFRRLRQENDWATIKLAKMLGVSTRTIEGWEQGRMPTKTALLLLSHLLE